MGGKRQRKRLRGGLSWYIEQSRDRSNKEKRRKRETSSFTVFLSFSQLRFPPTLPPSLPLPRQRSSVTNQLWRERDKPTVENASKPHAILNKVASPEPGLVLFGCQRFRPPAPSPLLPPAARSLTDPHALPQSMADSFTEAFLPFSTDKQLLEEYLTYAGTIRVGKLLEDLDALAGTIAYK